MSIEQAQAFLEKVKSDETLQRRLNEAKNNASKLEIASQEGFEFTEDEIRAAKSELGDELDFVSAGSSKDHYCCWTDWGR